MVDESGIRLEHVGFRIGDFALEDISLDVRAGEYFVLMGPNGAGKTTLVKLILGLCTPTSGGIFISNKPMTEVPPWKRNIGYVPQEYALFPNMTVEGNVAFGLKVRRAGKEQTEQKVRNIAELLGISRLLQRMPEGLSGGEQQKVSLARALVLDPSVLLLDEPVSAIDEDTRDQVCSELKNIQRRTRVTTIHVCHNRREAELVAERTGVLHNGVLEVAGRA